MPATTTTAATTALVTLTHAGFWRDGENPGRRVLKVEVPAGATLEEKAEAAFRDTNSPYATPAVVEQSGRCYSLSVGDFVTCDGETVMVAGCGFTPVTEREFLTLLGKQGNANDAGVRWTMDFDGVRALAEMRKPKTA